MDTQRLTRKKEELEDQWELLTEKLTCLKKARILETRPDEKFRLEKEIDIIEAERQQIEKDLNDIKAKLNEDVSPIVEDKPVPKEEPGPDKKLDTLIPDHIFTNGSTLELMRKEWLKGKKTFYFDVLPKGKYASVGFEVYFNTPTDDSYMPVDGFIEVDGNRIYTWKNRHMVHHGLTITKLARGKHTVTVGITDRDQVLVNYFQLCSIKDRQVK